MWFKKNIPENLTNLEKDQLTAYIGQSYTDMNLVGQYENAIDILINQIIEKKFRIDVIAHPLLYLIRHSLELLLKENIKELNKYSKLGIDKKFNTHKLSDLFVFFENHYDSIATKLNFKEELKEEYVRYSSELHNLILFLGEDASTFRYTFSQKNIRIFDYNERINIVTLKKQFDNSITFLTHTLDVISPFTNYADYVKFDSSIINESFGYVLFCFNKSQNDWLIEKLNEKHKIIIPKKIWFDENENYFLNLKYYNKKCYVIPMKK